MCLPIPPLLPCLIHAHAHTHTHTHTRTVTPDPSLRSPAPVLSLLPRPQSSLVERLERAGAAGWLPAELREPARQLFLDAHAARRMEMEGMAAGL